MRILIDALGIGSPGGGRSATLNWLTALLQQDSTNTYLILVDQREPELDIISRPGVRFIECGIRNRFAIRLVAQSLMPWISRHVDIVHFSKNLTAVTLGGKTVVTIYDLSAVTLSWLYPLSDRILWRYAQPLALRRVDHIVAISEQTAREIARCYGIAREKITVIYPSCHARYRPEPEASDAAERAAQGIANRYVLTVGAASRKKNISALVRAYALARREGYEGDLVLVGARYGKLSQEDIIGLAASLGVAHCVKTLAMVPDHAMPALYRGADAFVMPSLCEGFGLSALEALSCGAPTIVSGTTAMSEVVGPAGLLIPAPTDFVALASLIGEVVFKPEVASRLAQAGIARSKIFSPTDAAARTQDLYTRLLIQAQ